MFAALLDNLFGRPPTVPGEAAPPLRAPEIVAVPTGRWEDDRRAALRQGEQRVLGSTRAAFGTRGYTLRALERAGLMSCELVFGDMPDQIVRIYRPTKAGRAVLAILEGTERRDSAQKTSAA